MPCYTCQNLWAFKVAFGARVQVGLPAAADAADNGGIEALRTGKLGEVVLRQKPLVT